LEIPANVGANIVFKDQPFLYIYIHILFSNWAESENVFSVDAQLEQKV